MTCRSNKFCDAPQMTISGSTDMPEFVPAATHKSLKQSTEKRWPMRQKNESTPENTISVAVRAQLKYRRPRCLSTGQRTDTATTTSTGDDPGNAHGFPAYGLEAAPVEVPVTTPSAMGGRSHGQPKPQLQRDRLQRMQLVFSWLAGCRSSTC